MKESGLIRNAKNRDFTRLPEWIDLHSGKIERFAIQFGLSKDAAYEATLDTFITFRKNLEAFDDSESLVPALYKIGLRKISELQSSIPFPDDFFSFTEDIVLHSEIVKLNVKLRVPFILSLFHDLDNIQIASITGESPTEVETRIQNANNLLGTGLHEKHLLLLGKSYNRIPVQFKSEQILGTIHPSAKIKKISALWPVVGILVFTLILISIQFAFPIKKEQGVKGDEGNEIFTKIEERYKAERDKRQEMLALEDSRFNELHFIQAADERILGMKNIIVVGDRHQIQDMEAELEKVINNIKLPAEMINDVLENPFYDGEEEASLAFLRMYREKVNNIIAVYDGILWDYREVIEDFDQGFQKASSMMLTRNKFPEELQNVIDTMRDHSIKLCDNKNTMEIKACYYNSVLHERMQYSFHHNTQGFANMMTFDYFLTRVNMQYSPDWISRQLSEIQPTLFNAIKDDVLYPLLESYYIQLFYDIIKGNEFMEAYKKQGKVPDEYQMAWSWFASYDQATPLSYLANPILEEMAASDWRSSESWEQFNRDKIVEALELAKEGKLEEIMYGKRPILEDDSIEFPNTLFSTKAADLYKQFKQSYDIAIFKELSPLYIVGVFDYANEMDDPETIYHLFHEDFGEHSETGSVDWNLFKKTWRKGFSLFQDAKSIEFISDELMRYRKNYYFDIRITYDDKNMVRTVGVVLDENGVWYIRSGSHEPLPSSIEYPEVLLEDIFSDNLQYIYDNYINMENSSLYDWGPFETIGLYFYAAEIGDFETQYSLYFQEDRSQTIEIEQYISDARGKEPQLNMMDRFRSISFKGLEPDENGNWPGIATLTVDVEKNPNEATVKHFKMMWTKNGWRVLFNPME